MKNLEIILVGILLFIIGCASNSSTSKPFVEHFNKDEYTYIRRVSNVFVYIDNSFKESDREEIMRQVVKQTDAYQADFKVYVEPISVYVANKDEISCGDRVGRFVGCFYAPRGPIRVVFKQNRLLALYHEYAHWMHPPSFDLEHEDYRWESEWDPRQRELSGY